MQKSEDSMGHFIVPQLSIVSQSSTDYPLRRHLKSGSCTNHRKNRKSFENKYTSISTVLQIQKCIHLSENVSRKNAISFDRKQNYKGCSNQFVNSKPINLTPFQNRKMKDRKNFETKLRELKQRKSLSYILEGNVKNWLIISEIQTHNLRNKSKMTETIEDYQTKQEDQNGSSEQKINVQSCTMNLLKSEQLRKDKMGKVKLGMYLKHPKHKSNYSMLRSCTNQTPQSYQSFQKFAVENLSNSTVKQTPGSKDAKRSNFSYNKMALHKEKLITCSPYKRDKNGFHSEDKQIDRRQREDVLDGGMRVSKISMCKLQPRPHTAIIKGPKAKFAPKRLNNMDKEQDLMRQVSGWQDLTDSFQKQINF